MSNTNLEIKDNTLIINGELTRHTISRGFEKASKRFQRETFSKVDLTDVSRVDTAGLAWLLSLVENAKKSENQLHFSPVSSDLLKLAKLTGVESFLQAQ